METKKCSKCGEVKELGEFHRCRTNPDGHHYHCKTCRRENETKSTHGKATKKKYNKIYYQNNKESILARTNGYKKVNSKKIQAHVRERRLNDEFFALKERARRTVRRGLFEKSKQSTKLLGCSWKRLRVHIESQFSYGMSWENRRDWHIDHIKPLATAKDLKEQEQLHHYTNLRPLWASENQSRPSDGSDLTSPWPRNS